MTKLKFLMAFSIATVLCFGLNTNQAQAGAVEHLVGGEINELEDDNFELFIDNDNDGSITVGDYFMGVITIQAFLAPPGIFPATYDPGAGDPTITGVFLLEAKAVVDQGAGSLDGVDNTVVYYGSVGATTWSALTGFTLPDPVNADTTLVLFDDVTPGSLTTAGSVQASIDSFTGANKVYEAGFADANNDGIGDAGEFWIAHGDAGTDAPGLNLASIRNIINLDLLGNFNGAPELLPHTYLSGDGAVQPKALDSGVTYASAQEIQAEGTISDTGSGVWQFKTDTNAYIQPVPEPSSIVLMGLGMAGLGFAGYRRRRQARKVA